MTPDPVPDSVYQRVPSFGLRRREPGIAISVLALVVIQLLLLHGLVPNLDGYASLAESFLPWLGLPIIVLAALVLRRFSRLAALAVAASALVWALLFVPSILPHGDQGAGDPGAGAAASGGTFTVASENVKAGNPRVGDVAASLAATGADVVAIQELDSGSQAAVAAGLDPTHPFSTVVGTVGVWSTTPILDSRNLDLGLGWTRALWVDVDTDAGRTRVYVVHLDSIRPGQDSQRDEMLRELRTTLAADVAERIVVVGDFNSATTDRAFARLSDTVTDVGTSTVGLGFTWPSAFPLARLDHLLVRGLTSVSSVVMPANGSDHRGILVTLR
ncbi:endonuclease/exonuclease/phosphatase family protein [Cryobacterium melibiosiphilum]|uniref:endonuclease/exonuclease/phosphatase family protein n=1 Tax=Cryobacterium melibiosiphilum TaxID=995039 RepID=UPI001313E03E|nr:endonuclease/exonuclease/phosphatase family protein [Cryobacterium melibiosiphilum]